MNRILPFVAFVFAGAASAQEMGPELKVRVEGSGQRVLIAFHTVENQPEACPLTVQSLSVDSTHTDVRGLVNGVVDFQVGVEPDAICLQVVGQQEGSLVFERGPALPALAAGRYDLLINDTSYGVLLVNKDGAKLVAADDGV